MFVQNTCRFNASVMMTPITRRKRQKLTYHIITSKISCRHYYARRSWHIH